MRRQSGFTLIELMITVVIIGVLAAIAYPSYTGYTQKTRRVEAKNALEDLANRLERNYYNQSPPTYTVDMTDLGYAAADNNVTADGNYTLDITNGSTGTSAYALTATVVAGSRQASDTTCATFGLTSAGSRTPAACW